MESNPQPLISIITPAYTAAEYIRFTIESVLAQTWQNWEMVIADDCSKDRTQDIVLEYAAKDPRIRYVRHEVNGGPAKTRNTALLNAKGRFVAFLDSDDLWLPQKLEHQIQFMLAKKAGMSYTLYRRFRTGDPEPGRLIVLPEVFYYETLLKNTGIAGCSTVMLDKEITGDILFPLVRPEDFALWLSILKRNIPAYGLMEDLVRYRVSLTSVSGNKLRSAKWTWNVYRNVEKLSLPYAIWCFLNYSTRAFIRYWL